MSSAKQWDAWYAYLTEKAWLSKKPAFRWHEAKAG